MAIGYQTRERRAQWVYMSSLEGKADVAVGKPAGYPQHGPSASFPALPRSYRTADWHSMRLINNILCESV